MEKKTAVGDVSTARRLQNSHFESTNQNQEGVMKNMNNSTGPGEAASVPLNFEDSLMTSGA